MGKVAYFVGMLAAIIMVTVQLPFVLVGMATNIAWQGIVAGWRYVE